MNKNKPHVAVLPALLLSIAAGAQEPQNNSNYTVYDVRRTGRDHVVLAFNFNPVHRDLNHSDYRFPWNAILNRRYILDANR